MQLLGERRNMKSSKAIPQFLFEIETQGFSFFDKVVPVKLLERMRMDTQNQIDRCQQWQKKNGLGAGLQGAAHHVIGCGDSFDEFLEHFFLDDYIRAFFDGEYILNTYGVLDNYSAENVYEHGMKFHRDIRTFSNGYRVMLNMLVMIDDFTLENGATKLVPGSHRFKERPDDATLEVNSVRATGEAGGILLFDSNLWHSAAPNITGKSRRALTPMFSRPFMKQQLDYPALLGESFPKTEKMRQLLGFNALVPRNHDEWYQPPERRKYKSGQG